MIVNSIHLVPLHYGLCTTIGSNLFDGPDLQREFVLICINVTAYEPGV
jgi:hypothetical protein